MHAKNSHWHCASAWEFWHALIPIGMHTKTPTGIAPGCGSSGVHPLLSTVPGTDGVAGCALESTKAGPLPKSCSDPSDLPLCNQNVYDCVSVYQHVYVLGSRWTIPDPGSSVP